MNEKILLVEDNETLGYILKEYLEMKGFDVDLAIDGTQGLRRFQKSPFDLCILDVMMPEMDGFELAKEIKTISMDMPIIFLTAKALKVDVLKGFNIGADDYIVKPVNEEELVARIKAVLRRSHSMKETADLTYEVGCYRFDFANQKLFLEDEVKMLTEKEAKLLKLLCEYKGRLLPRQKVLKSLWNNNDYFTRRSMDVFISRLRKYLSKDEHIQIKNVYGSGFIMTDRLNN
ncbi:MAG: response regulator transcription factor [Saprospiraceae bacterium]|nr:response regulator transcription factor [Saprospiraceae bacterium]